MEDTFSMWSVSGCYKKDKSGSQSRLILSYGHESRGTRNQESLC
jgi:hypothetical protein